MDLNPLLQAIDGVAVLVVVPIAGILARRGIALMQDKLHIAVSSQDQAVVMQAVDAAAGVVRAKLATGAMTIGDVHLGSPHIDAVANAALDMVEAGAAGSKLDKEDVAHMIVGAVGHALGDDPTVPTLGTLPAPVPQAAPAQPAATPWWKSPGATAG